MKNNLINRSIYQFIYVTTILVGSFMILTYFNDISFADKIENNGCYVLSNGSILLKCLMDDNNFSKTTLEIDNDSWENICWPNYNASTEELYFSAISIKESFKNYVYKINLSDQPFSPIPVVEGDFPSLSPEGDLLLFYIHPYQLWVLNLKNNSTKILVSDMGNYSSAVWCANDKVLYATTSNKLFEYNIVTGEKRDTGYDNVIPSSLSPDGNLMLCGSFDGNKIYLYSVKTKTMKVLKKSRALTIGSSFIWSSDGKSFLYTRQTWSNTIRISEAQDLFHYYLDGKEIHLLKNIALFGGVNITEQDE